jgi:hypothetical protein
MEVDILVEGVAAVVEVVTAGGAMAAASQSRGILSLFSLAIFT